MRKSLFHVQEVTTTTPFPGRSDGIFASYLTVIIALILNAFAVLLICVAIFALKQKRWMTVKYGNVQIY